MNCEEAENFISARVDGELPADDPSSLALDAHLAGCAACRATADTTQVQDAALVRAFAPGRRSADALAERAAAALGGEVTPPCRPQVVYVRTPRLRLWAAGLAGCAAAAAAVALAVMTWGPRVAERRPPQAVATAVQPIAQQPVAQPIAHLALSTGEVFSCPSHAPGAWKPVAPGAALAEGDRVRTAPSTRVELVLADGSQLRLNGGTEARLDGARRVELKGGQLWSAVPERSEPLHVTVAPDAGGEATAITPPGGHLDVACASTGSVLTAVYGPARVTDKHGAQTQVPAGTIMTLVNGLPSGRSAPADVLAATGWLNDLLVLKGRDDPELTARVNELLVRVSREAASATHPAMGPAAPGPFEQMIRAQADRWCEPLACHVQSPGSRGDRATRLTAARLLADLAPPATIPDLIALLGDGDGDVRFYAAKALHRLTGQNLGRTPEQCATDSADSVDRTQKLWQAWWDQNRLRYDVRPRKA